MATIGLDANGRQINGPLPFLVSKTVTFDGGTTNDVGDFNGTGNPATLFTVTGDVMIKMVGMVKTSLEGDTATLVVGTTNNTAFLMGDSNSAPFTATGLLSGMVFGEPLLSIVAPYNADIYGTNSSEFYINGANIVQTVGIANITAGKIVYYLFWRPLSEDGNVVAA
jgi:hypothetical protein